MEFNEKTAEEIVEKFKLDKKTIRVWRNRNAIPDKYLKLESPQIKIEGKRNIQLQKDIINLLNKGDSTKINVSALARLAGVDSQRLADIVRGKSSLLTIDELLALKKAIGILRNEAKIIVNGLNNKEGFEIIESLEILDSLENKIRLFFNREEIHLRRFIADNRLYSKVSAFARKEIYFPVKEVEHIQDAFALFLIETNIN